MIDLAHTYHCQLNTVSNLYLICKPFAMDPPIGYWISRKLLGLPSREPTAAMLANSGLIVSNCTKRRRLTRTSTGHTFGQ
jgi:hypothetical protein